jgi:hypothetical protein
MGELLPPLLRLAVSGQYIGGGEVCYMLGQVWQGHLYVAPLGAAHSHPLRSALWLDAGPVDALTDEHRYGQLRTAYWQAIREPETPGGAD